MYINICKEINNKYAVSMDSGALLYEKLNKYFKESNDKIVVDFEGLSVISSPFFNASISRLLKDYEIKEVASRLDLKNLPDYARNILNISIGNALEHYKKA